VNYGRISKNTASCLEGLRFKFGHSSSILTELSDFCVDTINYVTQKLLIKIHPPVHVSTAFCYQQSVKLISLKMNTSILLHLLRAYSIVYSCKRKKLNTVYRIL
jgi:hypothetical protein